VVLLPEPAISSTVPSGSTEACTGLNPSGSWQLVHRPASGPATGAAGGGGASEGGRVPFSLARTAMTVSRAIRSASVSRGQPTAGPAAATSATPASNTPTIRIRIRTGLSSFARPTGRTTRFSQIPP
jgi:hypothetical protein